MKTLPCHTPACAISLMAIALTSAVPAAVHAQRRVHAEMSVRPEAPRAGEPALLRFQVKDTTGAILPGGRDR